MNCQYVMFFADGLAWMIGFHCPWDPNLCAHAVQAIHNVYLDRLYMDLGVICRHLIGVTRQWVSLERVCLCGLWNQLPYAYIMRWSSTCATMIIEKLTEP